MSLKYDKCINLTLNQGTPSAKALSIWMGRSFHANMT